MPLPVLLRRCALRRVSPLILALLMQQSFAAVAVTGSPGTNGANGAVAGAPGGAGGAGGPANAADAPPAGNASATAEGGAGGAGGNGAAGDAWHPGGNAGAGGNGGAALAQATGSGAGGTLDVTAGAIGGAGGAAGAPGAASAQMPMGNGAAGGHGGAATAVASGTAAGATTAVVSASSRGGNGGAGDTGGDGGDAGGSAGAQSGSGAVLASVLALGGNGGEALGGGPGGRGGSAVLANAVSGSTTGQLSLRQDARGGAGGYSQVRSGDGGNALSELTVAGSAGSAVYASSATGGTAYHQDDFGELPQRTEGGKGGDATSRLVLTGLAGPTTTASSRADGGRGDSVATGMAGAGGNAEAVLTMAGVGSLSGTVDSTGGDAGLMNNMWEPLPGEPVNGGTARSELVIAGNADITAVASATAGRGMYHQFQPKADVGSAAQSLVDARSSGVADVTVRSMATGGRGSDSGSTSVRAGNGGSATARGYGRSAGGKVVVEVVATGGAGGVGLSGAVSGDGAGVWLTNAAAGSTTGRLELLQTARGGNGGSDRIADIRGRGGDADSQLSEYNSGAHSVVLRSVAIGGDGSYSWYDAPVWGAGGNANARSLGNGRDVEAHAGATGGVGFFGGAGIASATSVGTYRAISVSEGIGSAPAGYNQEQGAAGLARATSSAQGGMIASALARAVSGEFASAYRADATAVAVSSDPGGSSTALAQAVGGSVTSFASAHGSGAAPTLATAEGKGYAGLVVARTSSTGQGMSVETEARAAVAGNAVATAASNIGAAAYPTADMAAFQAVSYLAALPEPTSIAAMLAAAPNTAAVLDGSVLAVGTQVASLPSGAATALVHQARGQLTFTTNGGTFVLGLLGSSMLGAGFEELTLTVGRYSTVLFTQTFFSPQDALLFFSDHALSLGTLDAGTHTLQVWTDYRLAGPGGFSFDYAFGVTAVPEPAAWMLLLAGVAMLVLRKGLWRMP